MAFTPVNWLMDGVKHFCVKNCFLCIYLYILIYCIIFNLLFWTHNLALSFDLLWFFHWNDTIKRMHLHGNSRDKAALKRLSRQVYTMTTYITCLLKLGWCSWRLSPTERLWAASAHAAKSNTGITPPGTLCCRALLVLVSRTEMQPVSMQGMGFYPGAGKLQRELSYSWAVFQTLFLFFSKKLVQSLL